MATRPAADRAPRHRIPAALAWLAGLACIGCCLLPVLVAAGLLGSTATAAAKSLPALAMVLAATAVPGWWWLRRRTSRCGCSTRTATSCICAPGQTAQSAKQDISLQSRP